MILKMISLFYEDFWDTPRISRFFPSKQQILVSFNLIHCNSVTVNKCHVITIHDSVLFSFFLHNYSLFVNILTEQFISANKSKLLLVSLILSQRAMCHRVTNASLFCIFFVCVFFFSGFSFKITNQIQL